MKKTSFLLMLIIIVWNPVFGQSRAGETGLSFLKIGVDARAIGMGEAYSAVASNAAATFWNPAGLMRGEQSNVLFNHNEWIEGIRGEFAAVSIVGDKSAWGLHIRSFNIADIEVREKPTSNPLEETSAHYLSAGLSYARKLTPKLSAGATVKYLFEKIFIHSASGIAVDFGITYQSPLPNLALGLTVQNLGSMKDLRDEKTKLPNIVRGGFLYELPWNSPAVSTNIAGDVVKPFDEDVRFHSGAEVVLWEQIAMRGGYLLGYESQNYSLGLGFMRSSIRFDYAITPFSDDLGTIHRFTVNFDV